MWVAVAAVGGMALVDAQGRGGRGGGAGAPGAPPAATKGTVEQIVVHGASLEGNLEGDSPDRDATVYLPPSYAGSPMRRYPVLYLLHGYGGKEDTFTRPLANVGGDQDPLAAHER